MQKYVVIWEKWPFTYNRRCLCQSDRFDKQKNINKLTSVGPPEFLHPMPHQHDARELSEGFDDIEVAQGANLKESHAVFLCISPRLLRRHLPLESQVEPVAHQDPGNTWGMLMEAKLYCDNMNIMVSNCSVSLKYRQDRKDTNTLSISVSYVF